MKQEHAMPSSLLSLDSNAEETFGNHLDMIRFSCCFLLVSSRPKRDVVNTLIKCQHHGAGDCLDKYRASIAASRDRENPFSLVKKQIFDFKINKQCFFSTNENMPKKTLTSMFLKNEGLMPGSVN